MIDTKCVLVRRENKIGNEEEEEEEEEEKEEREGGFPFTVKLFSQHLRTVNKGSRLWNTLWVHMLHAIIQILQ